MRGMTLSILAAIVLTGCNSNSLDNQIEKCVQAGLKSVNAQTEEDRAKHEYRYRRWCLEAASGKSN